MQVKSDASAIAIGALLEQQHGNVWHPANYFLKRLNDTESRYNTTEHDVLVFILAMKC